MRCQKVKKQLILFVGDDLPERKKKSVEIHLEHCPGCAAELEGLKKAINSVHKISKLDLPDALPPNFSEKVTRVIHENQKDARRSRAQFLFLFPQKTARIVGAFALGILLILTAFLVFHSPEKVTSDQLLEKISSIPEKGSSELAWDPEHVFFKAFDGPHRLDSWEAPSQSGVYAVMHKKDSKKGPSTFIIDYCGQGRNLSLYKGYPWIHHRLKRLITRTGSLENIYVAVFLMPDSSKQERRQIEKVLVKTFNPFFNRGV
ncbi:MAG: hypothetical protein JSV17_01620 [Candidatus Aminicenantes bacterium]|nr:MAG: hypothetical protein JSV17_01620 [Candidatus Aminicenantes bacterium]